jgi:hypothetical protein
MKYPEMKPAGSTPTLFAVNGVGTQLYGSRDLDRATGSDVKTQCFCLLFIPVLALKSYRVVRQGAGWVLLGRVPLSRFAKSWNLFFLCAIVLAIGGALVAAYLNDPDHLAANKLTQADEAAAAGRLSEASRLYREVAQTRTQSAVAARQRSAKLVERPEVDGLPLGEVTQIFDAVLQSRPPGDSLPAVAARGAAIVKARAKADPVASMELLRRVAQFSPPAAGKTFAELIEGPFSTLPPAETVAVFRAAATAFPDDNQKGVVIETGVKQCRRLAAADLPAAVDLLAVLAPLGDQAAVNKCLAELLSKRLETASCSTVAGVVQRAKAFLGPSGEKELFQAGIGWVEHHPQAAPGDVLDLLDQLAS